MTSAETRQLGSRYSASTRAWPGAEAARTGEQLIPGAVAASGDRRRARAHGRSAAVTGRGAIAGGQQRGSYDPRGGPRVGSRGRGPHPEHGRVLATGATRGGPSAPGGVDPGQPIVTGSRARALRFSRHPAATCLAMPRPYRCHRSAPGARAHQRSYRPGVMRTRSRPRRRRDEERGAQDVARRR
jgi:hypothetical protein